MSEKIAKLRRCCGPAGAASERDDAYRIDGEIFIPIGLHRGSHQTWECLENLKTGEHKDLCTFEFEAALSVGQIELANAMEVLALAATLPGGERPESKSARVRSGDHRDQGRASEAQG